MTYQEGFPIFIRTSIIKLARLNDLAINIQLVICLGEDVFFNRVGRDQAEDADFLGLANAMRPVLSLEILMGIPIRVKDNHCIGGLKVETKTTRSCAE
jgi:hypothetical protein